MPAAPEGVVETGAPSFVVLGAESMGLSAPPTDLHLLPDGRIVAVSLREIAFGDGLRWDVYRGIEGEEFIAPQVVVDSAGNIYTGVRGGFARIDLGGDARWHLTRMADVPAIAGIQNITMAWGSALSRDWYWYSGSGSIIAWRPGQPARIVGNIDTAVEKIFELGPDVFISDQSVGGLFRIHTDAGVLQRISPENAINEAVTSSIPFASGKLLTGTSFAGVKIFDGKNFQPFGDSRLLGPGHRITDLCAVGDGYFAAGVDTIGIVFFNRHGRIVQVLDRSLDHRLARVRRLAYSSDGVLWALLNDSVARVRFPSPVSLFEPIVASGLVYAKPLRHAGELWLLTDGRAQRGVYNSSGRLERFDEDSPPGRFLFTLSAADGQLFASNDAGIFIREESGWTLAVPGIVNARVGVGRPTAAGIPYVARHESGFLQRTAHGFVAQRHPLPELGDNYNAVQDATGIVWLELGTSRVGRVNFAGASPTLEILGPQHGLTNGWVSLYTLDGIARFHLATHFLRFDDATHRFVEDKELLALFPEHARPDGRLAADPSGRIWYTANGIVHVTDRSVPGHPTTTIPVGFSPTDFTIEDDGVVWLFEKQRLARLDQKMFAPITRPLRALITSVEYSSSGRWEFAPDEALDPIAYSDNTLVIRFAAPSNPFGPPIAFEVLLEGAGGQWVSTGTVGSATFNRLKEGHYVFRVRPVAGASFHGTEARLAFTVRPPWFRTPLAWIIYALSALGLVAFAAWLSSFLQRRENERLERLVGERTRALSVSEERYRTLNTELEQRVHTRTAELSLSNAELQQRESLFRLIFEHAPVGIFWKRSDLGGVYHFNPTFRRILGLSPQASLDYTLLLKLVHPDDASHQAAMTRLIESNESDRYNLEERFVLADGRIVWGSLSVAVIRDPDGNIVQEIGILEDITASKQAEQELAATYKNLVATSRIAGMAEVATGVLHNVGNVLNSLNISSNVLADGIRHSKTDLLIKLAALVNEHAADLGGFLTHDPKGQLVPKMLTMLAEDAASQREWIIGETAAMQKNIDHIKEIVAMQQSYATMAGVVETLEASSLFEDALRMNESALSRHEVSVIREYLPVPPLTVEKGKVLQILINLLRNAKYACDDSPGLGDGKMITVGTEPGTPGCVRLVVRDNGIGIAPENLRRLFTHGFTTRSYGHGFGLHASIIAANEMKGSLTAHSDGVGRGATFVLELPISPAGSADHPNARAAFPLPAQPKSTAFPRNNPDEPTPALIA